jgi:hypothetical protein
VLDLLVLLECGAYDHTFWQPKKEEPQGSGPSFSLFYVAKECLEADDVGSMKRLESATDQEGHQLVKYTGIVEKGDEPLLSYSFGGYLPKMIQRPNQDGNDDPALMDFLLGHRECTSPTIVTDAIRYSFRHLESLILSMGKHGRMDDLKGVDHKGRTPLEVAELSRNETAQKALKAAFSS